MCIKRRSNLYALTLAEFEFVNMSTSYNMLMERHSGRVVENQGSVMHDGSPTAPYSTRHVDGELRYLSTCQISQGSRYSDLSMRKRVT